jgi:hypothetical protein
MLGPYRQRFKTNSLWPFLLQEWVISRVMDINPDTGFSYIVGVIVFVDFHPVTVDELEYLLSHAPQPLKDFSFIRENPTFSPRNSCTI